MPAKNPRIYAALEIHEDAVLVRVAEGHVAELDG
jgi:hypothetical protein